MKLTNVTDIFVKTTTDNSSSEALFTLSNEPGYDQLSVDTYIHLINMVIYGITESFFENQNAYLRINSAIEREDYSSFIDLGALTGTLVMVDDIQDYSEDSVVSYCDNQFGDLYEASMALFPNNEYEYKEFSDNLISHNFFCLHELELIDEKNNFELFKRFMSELPYLIYKSTNIKVPYIIYTINSTSVNLSKSQEDIKNRYINCGFVPSAIDKNILILKTPYYKDLQI